MKCCVVNVSQSMEGLFWINVVLTLLFLGVIIPTVEAQDDYSGKVDSCHRDIDVTVTAIFSNDVCMTLFERPASARQSEIAPLEC